MIDIGLAERIKLGLLWGMSALHFVNTNLPLFIGWATLMVTIMQMVISYRKMRAKPGP